MRHYACLLLFVLATCFPVPRPNVQLYGTVNVAFGVPLDDADPWRDDQLAQLRRELGAMQALGPAFVETSEMEADFVLRPFDSQAADPAHRPCGQGVARDVVGYDYAEIDATCTHGFDELRAAAGHEIGHFMRMVHICEHEESDPTCDPRWRGDAVMNPSISYLTDGMRESDDSGGDVTIAQSSPTSLDVADFRAARAGRTRYAAQRRTVRWHVRPPRDAGIGASADAGRD